MRLGLGGAMAEAGVVGRVGPVRARVGAQRGNIGEKSGL